MNERDWVKTIINKIEIALQESYEKLRVVDGFRVPYSSEILSYIDKKPKNQNFIGYESDILILEQITEKEWKPRIIIETKINSITTHDAITYSQKSQTHKNVHPYLRYGILIGNMGNQPLPGRLFRHGQHFDFMQSWKNFVANEKEWSMLLKVLKSEYKASLTLDEIIYNSRSHDREKYSLLHRPLILEN